MESWGPMLRALLSGPGRRGGTRGWAFRSGQPHLPLAGLSSATELVNHWTGVFEKRGIPEARESSEYIVAHVLGAKTFQSLRPALRTQPLSPQQLQCIQELSSCRLQRMPVQYILGEWDFKGLSLKMAPPVFIPRPETEELVEWVLEEVVQRPRVEGAQDGPLILEVGCGSGAIALSLLSQLPESRVIAVDKGEAAISLTHENAQRLRLQDRIWMVPLDVTLAQKGAGHTSCPGAPWTWSSATLPTSSTRTWSSWPLRSAEISSWKWTRGSQSLSAVGFRAGRTWTSSSWLCAGTSVGGPGSCTSGGLGHSTAALRTLAGAQPVQASGTLLGGWRMVL
ncbi:hemK methyltransferase family member 1 isoform X4 [Tupaia chinensis]|uniref:hemK methyltransferase family member 1 isoform X4 n=1 Tax=Tupaia chinensis TaxID=246437 RepID=UPI0003C8E608|nr:hemK methyltransferase family member 1 isoform X4 [Tupaia chinensis]